MIEQKLEMTESELRDHKSKQAQKDADMKELNRELIASRKELATLAERLRLEEMHHADEVASLKEELAKPVAQPMTSMEQQLSLMMQTFQQ